MKYEKPYSRTFPSLTEVIEEITEWELNIELTEADLRYLNPFYRNTDMPMNSSMTVSC